MTTTNNPNSAGETLPARKQQPNCLERIARVSAVIRQSQQPAGEVYFIANRDRKTVELLDRRFFSTYDMAQMAFRGIGFLMSDKHSANMLGKAKSLRDFKRRAANGNWTVLA